MMTEICGDNRFEIISKAKEALLESTNIEASPEEMVVIDSFLFRCWQMGWLDKYTEADGCNGCKYIAKDEYDEPCLRCRRNCKDYWRAGETK